MDRIEVTNLNRQFLFSRLKLLYFLFDQRPRIASAAESFVNRIHEHSLNSARCQEAIRKLPLLKAKRYLEDVIAHKQAITFTRFCRGVGRNALAKNMHSNGQERWPAKSAQFVLDSLKNAERNAEVIAYVVVFDVLEPPLTECNFWHSFLFRQRQTQVRPSSDLGVGDVNCFTSSTKYEGYRVLCTEKAELIETGSGCATYPALMGSLPACSDLTSVGVVRYRVELSISDGTESAVFFVFYAEISWLTNVRAAEISELRSVQKQQVMSSILAGSLHSNNSFQELVAHSRRLAQSK
ncbi:unnamed protein product [Brassica rapa]|uniref:Uncharacterized protein n=1 Tax=Brassica campestris TaxID=3711 RepID=A0A8D9GI32_BRACM|nr:unnamed protein product [Brassica rapa]